MKKFLLFWLLLPATLGSLAQTPLTTAVQFEAKDFNGDTHNLFDYLDNGKYVLLSFYTMNCGSCQNYSPGVSSIYEQFGCNNADLIVLGINWGATNSQLFDYHQEYGWNFPALSGVNGYGNEITEAYLVESFISVILIAPDREIVNQYIDPPTTNVLESLLMSYGLNTSACTVGTETLVNQPGNNPMVFPNPAKAFFDLSLHAAEGNHYVGLYDLNGRLVRDYGSHTLPFHRFLLEDIEAGVYLVKVQGNNLTAKSIRLIVLP
jgi:thiol-disulfide isomerase/thioredoxin